MRTHTIALGLLATIALAAPVAAAPIQTVFVIALENHNFTQPASDTSPQQILGNPAAPYVNSLITPGNPNAAMTSFATNYQSADATHPSEPNYIYSEAGSNLGNTTDADPSAANGNIYSVPHLTGLMQQQGVSWKSYQEDTNMNFSTNTVLPQNQWTVPLVSQSGTNPGYTNPYNGSHQYSYAAKHDPQVFFSDTNNPGAVSHYAPLQQLSTDLVNNSVAKYNWITPDQYNEMHSSLSGGFTYKGVHYTGDQAAVAEGDNFLSIVVPQIEASQAYKDNGMIVLWWTSRKAATARNTRSPRSSSRPMPRATPIPIRSITPTPPIS
ncbi:MAG: alkaline phosphatase family protein [Stellaceae bacterium]